MEWVSVKERLPENANEVLVIERWMDYPFVGYYGGNPSRWIVSKDYLSGDFVDSVTQKDVTHWCELPDLPKERCLGGDRGR